MFFNVVGETFLQIIQRAGRTLANSPIIVSKVLLVLRSEIPEMQSSALILLSYICEDIPDLTLPYLSQILGFVQGVLNLGKEVHHRRGNDRLFRCVDMC
jgi:hypothetical protein